jgi:FkbM family methyltransferase
MNLKQVLWQSIDFRLENFMRYAPLVPQTITRSYANIYSSRVLSYWESSSADKTNPAYYIVHTLKKGDTYLDIGAHLGKTTLLASTAVGNTGTVYAFEPQRTIFKKLEKTCHRFGWDNVELNQTVVSDRTGEISFHEFDDNTQMASLSSDWRIQSQPATRLYPTTTLDRWMADKNLQRIALIKIDVEGAELMVLNGAQDTLRRLRPHLLLEIHQRERRKNLFNYTVQDVLQILTQAGYTEFYALRAAGLHNIHAEADLIDTDHDLFVKGHSA